MNPVVVDNADQSQLASQTLLPFQKSGNWNLVSQGFSQGVDGASIQGDSYSAIWGTSVAEAVPVANWNFEGLPEGRYAIFVTWPEQSAAATNVTYHISTDRRNDLPNGQLSSPINQTLAPADRVWAGTPWQQLRNSVPGQSSQPLLIEVKTGTLRVFLSAATANGTIVADAVRIEPVMADAFAWDGAAANNPLARFVGTGDINGDGKLDYVFADNDKAYVFFGPVDPRSLFRVDTEDLNFDNVKDLRIRGKDWSYDVPFDSVQDLEGSQSYYRISGRADVIFNVGSGPLTIGDFSGDGAADLAVLSGANQLRFFYGGNNLQREVSSHTTINLPTPALPNPQIAAINWNQLDSHQDLVLFAGTGSSNDAESGAIGYVYSGAALTAASPTVLTTFTADGTSRQTRLTELALDATHSITPGQPRQFAIQVVGDVNGVGGDELLIVDRNYLPLSANSVTDQLPNVGRAYLVSGQRSLDPLPVTITTGSPTIINSVAHGFKPGDLVTFGTTGSLPIPLFAGMTYYVISDGYTADRFLISDIPDGPGLPSFPFGQSGNHWVEWKGGQIGSRFVWEDYGLAYPHAVGDVNQDGFVDFAISTVGTRRAGILATEQQPERGDAGLYVLSGSTSYGNTTLSSQVMAGRPGATLVMSGSTPLPTLNARLAELRVDSGSDAWNLSRLHVSAGDFDGDGRIDLAIGQPLTQRASTSTSSIYSSLESLDARGLVSVFYSAADRSLREVIDGRTSDHPDSISLVTYLSQAGAVITGESATHGFGILPTVPRIDVDGDGIDDLLIAAPNASTTIGMQSGAHANAGRIYVIHGAQRTAPIPFSGNQWLTNRDIPESGLYLVEQADGQPFRWDQDSLFGTGLIAFGEDATANQQTLAQFATQTGTAGVEDGDLRLMADPVNELHPAIVTLPATGGKLWLDYQSLVELDPTQSTGLSGFVVDYRVASNGRISYLMAGLDQRTSEPRWVIYRVTQENGAAAADWQLLDQRTVSQPFDGRLQLGLQVRTSTVSLAVAEVDSLGSPIAVRETVVSYDTKAVLNRGSLGLSTTDAASFNRLSVTDTERWYRFSTLGDGQIGDVLKVRARVGAAGQEVETTSRPAAPQLFASDAKDEVRSAILGGWQPEITVVSGVLKNTVTGYASTTLGDNVPSGKLQIGGDDERVAIVEVDLSRFLTYTDDPLGIENVGLTLRGITGPASTIQAEVLDRESNLVVTAGLATAAAERFRHTIGNHAIASSSSAWDDDIVTLDLTQQVRDALVAGRTRVSVRLASSTTDQHVTLNAFGLASSSPSTISVSTALRHGLVADVYDSSGRRWAQGLAIMDMRNLTAGDYIIRIHDPFEDRDSIVYRKLTSEGRFDERDALQKSYRRDVPLKYTIEIEPPKIGDSHAVLDRDEIDGGLGEDFIQGNGSVDRIYGGKGLDNITAEMLEIRDLGRFLGEPLDTQLNLKGIESTRRTNPRQEELSHHSPRPIDFLVNFDPDDTQRKLERLIAYQLGLANFVTDDSGQAFIQSRPLKASDLTSLVELNASFLGLTDSPTIIDVGWHDYTRDGDNNPLTQRIGDTLRSNLAGIEYATNLEILSLAGNTISNLSMFEPGIRLGREEQGELGLRNLQYLDLDFNPIIAAPNEAYPPTMNRPLEAIGQIRSLEFLSIDELRGEKQIGAPASALGAVGTSYDLRDVAELSKLRKLSARNLNLGAAAKPDWNFGRTSSQVNPLDEWGTLSATSYSWGSAVHVLPDGKILIAGGSPISTGNSSRASVSRLNPDGTLDTSFGTNGTVTLPGTVYSFAYAMAVTSVPNYRCWLSRGYQSRLEPSISLDYRSMGPYCNKIRWIFRRHSRICSATSRYSHTAPPIRLY